jgi:hypothetical protein
MKYYFAGDETCLLRDGKNLLHVFQIGKTVTHIVSFPRNKEERRVSEMIYRIIE